MGPFRAAELPDAEHDLLDRCRQEHEVTPTGTKLYIESYQWTVA